MFYLESKLCITVNPMKKLVFIFSALKSFKGYTHPHICMFVGTFSNIRYHKLHTKTMQTNPTTLNLT